MPQFKHAKVPTVKVAQDRRSCNVEAPRWFTKVDSKVKRGGC